jgi:restriction system protein
LINVDARGAIPKYHEFHWPVIRALKEMGGSASIAELNEKIASDMRLPEHVLEVPHGDGAMTEVEYRLAWARTYLKKVGAINNSERGIWALTPKGREFDESDAAQVTRTVRLASVARRKEREAATDFNSPEADAASGSVEADVLDWKERLLRVLKDMPADAFERLSQRVLRESGFVRVEVTGRSGDGGIDGAGVLRMNIVSFHVLFQCKRWKDVVGASVIRDFRGAMIGRADKGLVITTGRFTADAQREAVRDGAPAIDLVDGEAFCELLKNLRLGIDVRTVEVIEIRPEIFSEI